MQAYTVHLYCLFMAYEWVICGVLGAKVMYWNWTGQSLIIDRCHFSKVLTYELQIRGKNHKRYEEINSKSLIDTSTHHFIVIISHFNDFIPFHKKRFYQFHCGDKTWWTPAFPITYADQVNPCGSYDPLLMSPVKSNSISLDEGVETERFLSLETFETWIVYVCHSEGEWARQKIEVFLNRVW